MLPASIRLVFLSIVCAVFQLNTTTAQLTGTKNIPGDYVDLGVAIIDLNTQGVGAGGVVLNLVAGNPQTAPAGGYQILTTTGSLANQIIINGNENTVTAFTPQTGGNLNDGIFKIVGADWVTINGFTLQENPGNNNFSTVSSNDMTEWGIALLYASSTNGSQNNTIQNNRISLHRPYTNTFGIYSNVRHTAIAVTATADIANGSSGPNKNNKIYGNSISNVNNGITMIGGVTVGFHDSGNDIGGTSVATGNTISDWGGAAPASGYVSVSTTSSNCIVMNNQISDNVSYNILTSAAVTPIVAFRGIVHEHTGQAPNAATVINITNNSVTMTSGQTSGVFRAIVSAAPTAPITMNIENNTIQNCAITGLASSTTMEGIIHSGPIPTLSISGNVFKNNTSSATTGGFLAIQNNGNITGTISLNNNEVGNGTGGGITFSAVNSVQSTFIHNVGGTIATTLSMNGNNFQGITYDNVSTASNTYLQNSFSCFTNNISDNSFTNLSIKISGFIFFITNSIGLPANGTTNVNNNRVVTGFNKTANGNAVYFYYNNGQNGGANSTETATNNNFSNINVGSTEIRGWFNNAFFTNKIMQGNVFSNISTSSTLGTNIIRCDNGGDNCQITGNTISGVSATAGINGITSVSTQPTTVYSINANSINNLAINANGSTALYGIFASAYNLTVSGNILNTFSTATPAGSEDTRGIFVGAQTNYLINGNKIFDMTASSASGVVFGIQCASNVSGTISNNIIGDLRCPNASVGFVNGIDAYGGTNIGVYYNTVFLNATSTGNFFSSYALS